MQLHSVHTGSVHRPGRVLPKGKADPRVKLTQFLQSDTEALQALPGSILGVAPHGVTPPFPG